MARWRDLGCPDGMSFFEVDCHSTNPRYQRRTQETFSMHLGRRGGYLRRINQRERFVDATSFALLRPGDDFDLAHPLDCGDVYTEIVIRPEALTDWPEGQRGTAQAPCSPPPGWPRRRAGVPGRRPPTVPTATC